MLLGGCFGEGLKPVATMGYTMLKGPGLHSRSDLVGNLSVHLLSVVNAVNQRIVGLAVEVLEHLFTIENQFTKELRRAG